MAAWWQDVDGVVHDVPRPEPLADTIRRALLNALAYTNGQQKEAASFLGLSERVLCYQLRVHGIPTAHYDTRTPRARIRGRHAAPHGPRGQDVTRRLLRMA